MAIPKEALEIASKNKSAFDFLVQGLTAEGNPATSGAADSFQSIGAPYTGSTMGGGGPAQAGFMQLLKNKDWKGLMKNPGGIMAGLLLAQFLYGSLKGKVGAARDQGMQQELIGQQMDMSEEDAYYQAALPSLTQERQQAQDALLQAIMGGRGQKIQVPGERQI